jgi:tRNA 2-thiouridine synthesizing protein A
MIEVDVRGFSCPVPVVRATEPIGVFVESAVSKENVSRLAKSRGYSITVVDVEDGFRLVLSPPGE